MMLRTGIERLGRLAVLLTTPAERDRVKRGYRWVAGRQTGVAIGLITAGVVAVIAEVRV